MNSMLSKSKGSNGRATSFSSSMNKKKPAPPRPPQPSVNRMQVRHPKIELNKRSFVLEIICKYIEEIFLSLLSRHHRVFRLAVN